MLTVAAGVLTAVGAVSAHARAAAAADLAALAAADAASGRIPGVPCDRADDVARANGAAIASCAQSGATVDVTAVTPWLGLGAAASARAGPGPGG